MVVKLRANFVNGPVFWLVQNAITVDGTIDLNGEAGHPPTLFLAERMLSPSGSGGYAGGLGEFGNSPQLDGFGPGGGDLFPGNSLCAEIGHGGRFTGNSFLVPLVGGSGGSGSPRAYPGNGGGGSGGGAIFIASSSAITVNGTITANGGDRGDGFTGGAGGGSGGAIRLAAPVIGGSGNLTVKGIGRASDQCSGGFAASSSGAIRLEAFSNTFSGSFSGPTYYATPFGTFLSESNPSVRVVSVNGVAVPTKPSGQFIVPDVVLASSGPISFDIEAHEVPTGTIVRLFLSSEDGIDQVIDSTPLAGTSQLSRATATATLPPGYSRGFVHASWIQ